MWQALDQQGIFRITKVVTGLAERATYPTFGPVASRISFISHYVYTAPRNKVNTWLVKAMRKNGQVPDLFTPDGFTAAGMIVHALRKAHGDDVAKMISALEGWRFTGVKGPQRIRPQDHAMLQPMFQVKLLKSGSRWNPKVLKRISPGNVQPPIRPFK
jgi:branched-chain amino acid transport system substrate-binding protein